MPQVFPFVAGFFGAGGAVSAFAGTMLGKAVVQLATSVALSALSRALTPKPKPVGMRTEHTLNGGVNPEAFVLGRFATSGAMLAPPMSHGAVGKTPNAYLNYVIEVAGIPGHEMAHHGFSGRRLIINGEACTALFADPHPDYGWRIDGRFLGRAWIRYHDGHQTAADPMLLAKYPVPHVRPWTADMIGTGICYAVLTFQFDREVYQSWPQVRFDLIGAPLYDPRKVGTLPGGSGAQRWDDPSTWLPSENNAVQVYNILRGIRLPSGDIWGGDIPAEDLPLPVWFAAMAACDLLVDDGDGGTEPQYRASMEVMVSDEPFAVISELLKPCLGALAESGGVWSIRVGAPGLPVMHIADADLLADAADDFKPFQRIDNIYNGIEATWPDPESLWESRDADPIFNPGWEAADGHRRLTTSISLPAAPYGVQVGRVMTALIKDHRRMRVHVISLPPEAVVLEPLDTITWTSASNYYTAKLFEVLRTERDLLTGRVVATLREVDPDDYDPPAGLTRPAPPDLRPLLPTVQAVPGWAVAPWTIKDGDSADRRPGIRMSWDPDGAADARGIRWAIRLAGDTGPGIEGPLHDVRTGMAEVQLLPATAYQVRARFVVDRPTQWSDWLSVLTPAVWLDKDLSPSIRDDLDNLHAWMASGVLGQQGDLARSLIEQMRAIRAEAAEGDAQSWLAEQQLRGAVARAEFTLSARITETKGGLDLLAQAMTEVATAIPGLATVEAVNALSGTVSSQGDQIATQGSAITAINNTLPNKAEASAVNALSTTVSSQGGQITSQASAIIALSAATGSNVGQANFRMEALSGPTGYTRIGAQTRQGGTGSWRGAAWYLDTPNNAALPTRFVVDADQFALLTSGGSKAPFVVTGDQIRVDADMQSANYSSGASGWMLDRAGAAQFNNLIVRNSLVVGAVSDVVQKNYPSTYQRTTEAWQLVDSILLGAMETTDIWTAHASAGVRSLGGIWEGVATGRPGGFRMSRRVQVDGVWGGYTVVGSGVSGGSTTIWVPITINETIAGDYTNVEYRMETAINGPLTGPTNHNFRRMALVARKVTR